MNFYVIGNELHCNQYPEFKKVFNSHMEAVNEMFYNHDQLENEVMKGEN
jgi:hypothetical protein